MIEHAPILIVVFPLLFAFLSPLVCMIRKSFCFLWTILGLLFSSISAITVLLKIMADGPVHYYLGSWAPPWGIEYSIDYLNAPILVLIACISLLVAVYSHKMVILEIPEKLSYFYTLFLLQVSGFLGIVITGDLFNLYVFLEIASLSGYALIAIGREHAAFAGFRYIVMGTIGASFYLLGVGYLYIATGSLNISDLIKLLPELYASKVVLTAFIFIIVGIIIKMALPPLHAWLADAYTYAPSATSALVAPMMTKISVYVLIRIMYKVFHPTFAKDLYPFADILGWLAVFGIIYTGFLALAQVDLKRMLSYLIMAEIGYIVIGVSCANKFGFIGAMLHLINDMVMMVTLFTAAGAISYLTKNIDIRYFRFLHRSMPVTVFIFLLSAFSVIGIPPFCGFFSKFYLILGTIDSGRWLLLIGIFISTFINAVAFFKIIEFMYIEPQKPDSEVHHEYEAKPIGTFDHIPVSMLVPLILFAAGILFLGIYSNEIITYFIIHAVPIDML